MIDRGRYHSESRAVHGLEAAGEVIRTTLADLQGPRPIVGVTGPVASGKSTLAARLAATLGGLALSTDRYLPDYEGLEPNERDDPARSDLARLAADLQALRVHGEADVPIWCFHKHRRIGEERVRFADAADGPVICEGLFALHPAVASVHTLRVFVEAPAEERWARWEAIERSGGRGWGVELARQHFDSVAEPTFARFAAAYRDAADLIVINRAER